MKNRKITRWPDLAEVTAVTVPLGSAHAQCAVDVHGQHKIHLLLLGQGMFSVFAHELGGHPADDAVVGLGRIVAAHVAQGKVAVTGSHLAREVQDLRRADANELAWHDLPGLTVSLRLVGQRILQCGLSAGEQFAMLLVTCDPILPLAWVQFSDPVPAPALLLALGRILIVHHDAMRRGDAAA